MNAMTAVAKSSTTGGRGTTRKIASVIALQQVLRKELYETVEPRLVEIFMLIAMHNDGIGQSELLKRTGLAQPVISRIVNRLGVGEFNEETRKREKGLGLVENYANDFDMRTKHVKLTAKGRNALAKILEQVE